jgi:hypothetical protein
MLRSGDGSIFLDEDEPRAPQPAKPAPQPAKPAPQPPKPALPRFKPASPSSSALDLLPEEPEEKPASPALDPSLDPRLAPTPSDETKPRESGRLKKTVSGVRVTEFTMDSNSSDVNASRTGDEDEESAEEIPPKDPAQAALFRFERTGEQQAFLDAKRLFQETAAAAPHGTAKAFAEAGLAKTALLAGNGPLAEQLARTSLDRDPGNPFAIEVVVKVARGDADRARLALGLAQARTLLLAGRGPDVRRFVEARLAPENPDAPQPWMLAAIVAKQDGDDARFEQMIAQAWARYPARRFGDLPLGGTLDVDFANSAAAHGRQKFRALDPEFLRRTIENVDSKENVVAGTFRLAVGAARVGIARCPNLSRSAKRKGWFAIATGLLGLQYYDLAAEAFEKANSLRPAAAEGKLIDNERRFAGQMRRAFDKPGVKAQLGKYKCVGVQALSQATQERLAAVQKDRAAREEEFKSAAVEIAELCARDAEVREEVRGAAESQHAEDPIIHVEVADAELAQIREERTRLHEPAAPTAEKKSGFFSKLAGAAHAAADKVTTAAKEAQLKLKETQTQARRDEAARKLGLTIGKDLRDHAWKSPDLVAFTKRAATLDAFIDFYTEEERLARVELDVLAKLSGG